MVSIKLSERDERIMDIHSELYPFVEYTFTGRGWAIKSPDYDEAFDTYSDYNEAFDTYEAFIEFIETEVKEALLQYAINGELGELAEI